LKFEPFVWQDLKVIKAQGTKNKDFMPSHSPKQRFENFSSWALGFFSLN